MWFAFIALNTIKHEIIVSAFIQKNTLLRGVRAKLFVILNKGIYNIKVRDLTKNEFVKTQIHKNMISQASYNTSFMKYCHFFDGQRILYSIK